MRIALVQPLNVEPGMMRHDQVSSVEKARGNDIVDHLPRHVSIGEAGDPRGFGRQRLTRILKPVPGAQVGDDLPLVGHEGQQNGELDELARVGRQRSRLAIEDRNARRSIRRAVPGELLGRGRQAAQNAVIAAVRQDIGRALEARGLLEAFHGSYSG